MQDEELHETVKRGKEIPEQPTYIYGTPYETSKDKLPTASEANRLGKEIQMITGLYKQRVSKSKMWK